MNAWLTVSRFWQPIIEAPLWAVLLVKLTAILLAAWLAHLALRRTNPRWRVFLWRVTAVGLVVLPAVAWMLPSLPIHVQPPPAKEVATKVAAFDRPALGHLPVGAIDRLPEEPYALLPSPASGRGFGGEGGRELENAKRDASSSSALTLTLSRRERGRSITTVDTKTLFLSAWLLGIAVLAFRLSVGHVQIRRLIGRTRPALAAIQVECARVARAVGCPTRVTVLRSPHVSAPLLCGLRRPLLMLPKRMCDDSYAADLPGILAHELTHVRSHDVHWNVGLQVLSIILWFHPLAWRMRKAHLAACELVCDAASASFVGDVTDYCRTLARVAVEACGSLPAAGIAMARTSAISRRLAALRTRVFHLPLRRRSVLSVGFAALLTVAVLGTLRFAFGAPPTAQTVATKKAAGQQQPWVVSGRVTDEQGQPVEGATLRAHCGAGTLFQTGVTKTEKNGRYVLRFGPGVWSAAKRGEPPLNLQAATISVEKPGFVEKNLHRQGDLWMANRLPPEHPWHISPDKIVLPDKPYPLDFMLVPAAAIEGELLDVDGKPVASRAVWLAGKELPPSCSVLRVGKTDERGNFRFEDVPPGYAWWVAADRAWGHDVRTASLRISRPVQYRIRLQLARDASGEPEPLKVLRVQDVDGKEVAAEVVGDDAPRIATVHGKVVDERGKPIAGADVWVMPAWNPASPPLPTHVTADVSGRFEAVVPLFSDRDRKRGGGGLGDVWAYAPGHRLAGAHGIAQILGSDKADVVIRLRPAVHTAFLVHGPDGKPLEGGLVEPELVNMRSVGGELPSELRYAVAAHTDANGQAVLTALPREALVSIRVVAKGLGIQTQQLTGPNPLPAGQPIRLRQAGRIAGRVTAARPEWAHGARILLYTGYAGTAAPPRVDGSDGVSMTRGFAEAIADAEGKFLVPAIAAGDVSMMAFVDDSLPVLPRLPAYTSRAISVEPGKTTSLEISLEPAVSVHGLVREKGTGKPAAEIPIQIRYGSDLIQDSLAFTDAKGEFTVPVLAGPIALEVLAGFDGKYAPPGESPRYEVPAGVKEFSIPRIEITPTKSVSPAGADGEKAKPAEKPATSAGGTTAAPRNWLLLRAGPRSAGQTACGCERPLEHLDRREGLQG